MSRARAGRRGPARGAPARPPGAPAPAPGRGLEPPARAPGWGRRELVLIAGVTFLHLATFVTKPAHMDDTLYLATARGILADPLRPLCNAYNWETGLRPIYTFAINPPLYNYQQALLVRLFGWNLTALHLLAACYVLLASVAAMALARRFTAWPLAAFLLLMLSPTLLPATNLMLDLPGMALVLAAVAAWVRGVDAGARRWLALGALAATLALWTKYNSMLALPLLALYALLQRRPRALAWLAVPVLGLGLWMLHNHFFMPGGAIHLFVSGGRARPGGLLDPHQVLFALASWGSSFLFLAVLAVPAWMRGHGRRLAAFVAPAALVLAAGVALALGPAPPWAAARDGEALVFIANGLLLAVFVGATAMRSWRAWGDPAARDDAFLLAWVAGITLFNVLFAPHQAPRYYFPAFAALPLLLVRGLARPGARPAPLLRALVAASIAAQGMLGLILIASDNAYARADRDFAARLAAIADARRDLAIYVGHWGFQYYADQHERLRTADERMPPPPPGTVVAINLDAYDWEYPAWLRNLHPGGEPGVAESAFQGPDGRQAALRFRLLEPEWSAPDPGPLRTVARPDGILLYASGTQVPYGRGSGAFHPTLVMEVIP